jgi:hypothetical protein
MGRFSSLTAPLLERARKLTMSGKGGAMLDDFDFLF